MADLNIDTASLRDLGGELKTISSEFENANTRSDTIAAAVGHSGLSDAVTDFAHGWDDRRAEMVESITFMSEAAQGIADAFEETDKQLADVLTEQPSAPQNGQVPR